MIAIMLVVICIHPLGWFPRDALVKKLPPWKLKKVGKCLLQC